MLYPYLLFIKEYYNIYNVCRAVRDAKDKKIRL